MPRKREFIATFQLSMNRFFLLQGSDPRVATCRGKLQNKRSKLNQEINKELRLRAGAENLFKFVINLICVLGICIRIGTINYVTSGLPHGLLRSCLSFYLCRLRMNRRINYIGTYSEKLKMRYQCIQLVWKITNTFLFPLLFCSPTQPAWNWPILWWNYLPVYRAIVGTI